MKSIFLTACLISVCINTTVAALELDYPPELSRQLHQALNAMDQDYQPRTRHTCNGKPCYTNRLILEQSPYLLQHAHNPVDWFPWGKEALALARKSNKPVFLSIGYAACHWCHVMEQESFDNEEIAKWLKEHFISIKLDREMRPDIDQYFADVVMHFQGIQGWPMSLFLTPNGTPIYGGNYYNPDDFKQLLKQVSSQWHENQTQTITNAQSVQNLLHHEQRNSNLIELDEELVQRAINDILSQHDGYLGGFGQISKFPREPWLLLLLEDSYNPDSRFASWDALNTTLKQLAAGGIHDQLAGGFHRYTVDPYWKEPHFEKMLYNQALLAQLFLSAGMLEANPTYLKVTRRTLDFILNEMRDPDGGFYASLDADTDEGEGYYYVWQQEQWQAALNQDDAELAGALFDIDEYGETEGHGNVLYLSTELEQLATEKGIPVKALEDRITRIQQRLLTVRNTRQRPALDHKIIMSWNSLAIHALAEAGYRLQEPRYLEAASQSALFIWQQMRDEDGFFRIHYRGNSSQPALLEDYAFYLRSLITLYDAETQSHWLDKARQVATQLETVFIDNQNGGFYLSIADEQAAMPIRTKSAFDKTLPSGNAIAVQSLLALYQRTGDEHYRTLTETGLAAFSNAIKDNPSAHAGMLIAQRRLQQQSMLLPRYAARGKIRIEANVKALSETKYALSLIINMEDAWHINSDQPLNKKLIPTRLTLANNTGWKLVDTHYPEAERINLSFSEQPLALYRGGVTINATLASRKEQRLPLLNLQLQACSDQICMLPEQIAFIPVVIP